MIHYDDNQTFVIFGKGTLLLTRGALKNTETGEELKMVAIQDKSDDPQPLGEFTPKEKVKPENAELLLLFSSQEGIDNFIEQLSKLRDA
ncbi:MAG: hypothetical protein M0P43_10705 [Arcobacteraceae bacterium]|nr:hypothetical protein [Arcobacteraceae bacterium]